MVDDTPSRIAQRRTAAQQDGGAEYAERRAELIRIAADVFRAKGFGAATLNDIAARFGTDRASLYYYVGSKQELFEECVSASVSQNLERAREIAVMEVPVRERLERLIRVIIESQVEHYPYQFVYIQENMQQVASQEAEWAQAMVDRTHELERVFIDLIAEGVQEGSFRADLSNTLIANSLFGMTQWTHRWWVPGQSKYDADDLIRVFGAVFFDGIDARG
jgi:TetR/AcrR family transcriptional regulator, cholesterol catabolism regulator